MTFTACLLNNIHLKDIYLFNTGLYLLNLFSYPFYFYFSFQLCLIINRSEVLSFIIRLSCKKHGNFSVIQQNKWRTGGSYSEVTKKSSEIQDISSTNCCLYCVARDNCDYVQYNVFTSSCYTMTTAVPFDDVMTIMQNMSFISTDYWTIKVSLF